jgi:hypothetical protein
LSGAPVNKTGVDLSCATLPNIRRPAKVAGGVSPLSTTKKETGLRLAGSPKGLFTSVFFGFLIEPVNHAKAPLDLSILVPNSETRDQTYQNVTETKFGCFPDGKDWRAHPEIHCANGPAQHQRAKDPQTRGMRARSSAKWDR